VAPGSTPALVNPTLSVATPTGGGGNTVLAMALERELTGSGAKHSRSSPKVSSRSVHGNYMPIKALFCTSIDILQL